VFIGVGLGLFQPCGAGLRQVASDHLRPTVALAQGESFGRLEFQRHVVPQQVRRFAPERLPVRAAMLRVPNQNTKARMHRLAGSDFRLLCDLLVEVFLVLQPLVGITIVDAVMVLAGNGPSFGKPEFVGKVLVGDAVDLEWLCARMLDLPTYPLLHALQSRGLLASEMPDVPRARIPLPDTYRTGLASRCKRYLNPEYWSSLVFGGRTIRSDWYELAVDRQICVRCGECISHCPTGAIDSAAMTVDPSICNRCLCCVENCPQAAVHVKTNILMRALNWIGSRFY